MFEKFGGSKRGGIEMELTSRVDQRVLRWFGHVERMDENRLARRVLRAGAGRPNGSGGRVRVDQG